MPTVRAVLTDAMTEIGALQGGEVLSAPDAQLALRYFQRQTDAWAADRLTCNRQSRTSISWPSGSASRTIGLTGGNITAQRPVWITTLNYVDPGSSPEVEVPIGQMNDDSYAVESMKAMESALPLSFYYQTANDSVLGTIILWPVPNQTLTLYLYAPIHITVPVTLDDILLPPVGYLEAFHYQLAKRLLNPFGVSDPTLVSTITRMAGDALAAAKRPNTKPGLLGVDAALMPMTGGAYNILSDNASGF